MMFPKKDFLAGPDDAGRRLDRVLRIFLEGLPLSAIYRALRLKRIIVNGRKADPSLLVSEGDVISVEASLVGGMARAFAPSHDGAPAASALASEFLENMILFQTPDIIFMNKPRNLPTHGPGGLDAMVRDGFAASASSSLAFRPAPLHRLDRNTSGILAFSLSIQGAHAFTAALRAGRIRKSYLALLDGHINDEELWEDRLTRDEELLKSEVSEEGDEAITRIRPLLHSARYSLVLVGLETGRTHQIRAQASAHGHPLAGDSKYGGSHRENGYILHAWRLDFLEPPLPGLPACLTAPLPSEALASLNEEFGASLFSSCIGNP